MKMPHMIIGKKEISMNNNNCFVIERGGVGWSEGFYLGKDWISNEFLWGSLERAKTFSRRSDAVSISYLIDDVDGIYTTVEMVDQF